MLCCSTRRFLTCCVALALAVLTLPAAALADHSALHSGQCFDASATGSLSGRTIIVDPGHGGSDPGAVHDELLEKDLNLQIAHLLKEKLRASGAKVCLTRTLDEAMSNNDRYTFANRSGGQALVSIHLNSVANNTTDYTMTMWGKKNKDTGLAQAVLPYLVTELATTPTGADTPIDSGRTAQFASGVLLKSEMPAILVEGVFLSNEWEANALRDGNWRQDQIAQAVHDGLTAFFEDGSPTGPGGGKGNGKSGGNP